MPYTRKVIDYREERRVEKVPKKKKIVELRDQIYNEIVPR